MNLHMSREKDPIVSKRGDHQGIRWRLSFHLEPESDDLAIIREHNLGDELVIFNDQNAAGYFAWRADELLAGWKQVPRAIDLDLAIAVTNAAVKRCRGFAEHVETARDFAGTLSIPLTAGARQDGMRDAGDAS